MQRQLVQLQVSVLAILASYAWSAEAPPAPAVSDNQQPALLPRGILDWPGDYDREALVILEFNKGIPQ